VQTYFLRRTLQAIPIIFILSMVIFGLVRLAPGGPLAQAERNPNTSPEQLARLREKLGLDQPLPVQYVRWLGQIFLEGDLGQSIKFRRPVTEMIRERLFNTFILVGASFIVTLLLAIPVGVISASKQYSTFDYLVTTLTFIGQSIPAYWLGLVLIVLFYLVLTNPTTGEPLLPASGMYSIGQEGELLNLAWHLVLPVATLSLASIAWYSRFLRSSMLDVLHEDYVRTARAKGLAERLVRYRHALGNAVLPLVTIVTLDLPTIFSGALFVETIFAWPGMGRLFWDAAKGRDYPVLLGIVMLNAILIVVCNLLADLIYGWLDPRIHYE
jgi:peptide/nickel transport system permease protein